MRNKLKIVGKKPETKKTHSTIKVQKSDFSFFKRSPSNPLLRFQGTMGNRVLQRLFKSNRIQTKLKIGKPNDKYEKEADRVSDQVMRMPDKGCPTCPGKSEEEKLQTKPLAHKITPLVQRDVEPEEEEEDKEQIQTRLAEGALIQRQGDTEEDEKLPETEEEVPEKEDEEETIQTKQAEITWVQRQGGEDEEKLPEAESEVPEKEDEETAQTKAVSRKPLSTPKGLHHQIQSMKGGGKPIPSTTRRYFESRFGANFRNVRVHTGSQAEKTARRIRSRAFTLRKNIFFGSGQYSPNTRAGKKLLAHELTHVVQQNNKNNHYIIKERRLRRRIRCTRYSGTIIRRARWGPCPRGRRLDARISFLHGPAELFAVSYYKSRFPSHCVVTNEELAAGIKLSYCKERESKMLNQIQHGFHRDKTPSRRRRVLPTEGVTERVESLGTAAKGAAEKVQTLLQPDILDLTSLQVYDITTKKQRSNKKRKIKNIYVPRLRSVTNRQWDAGHTLPRPFYLWPRIRPTKKRICYGPTDFAKWPGVIQYEAIDPTKPAKKKKKKPKKKTTKKQPKKKPQKKPPKPKPQKKPPKPKPVPKTKPKVKPAVKGKNWGFGISIFSTGGGSGNVGFGISINSHGQSYGTVSAGVVYNSDGVAVGSVSAGGAFRSSGMQAGTAMAGGSKESSGEAAGVAGAGLSKKSHGSMAGVAGAGKVEGVKGKAAGTAGTGTAKDIEVKGKGTGLSIPGSTDAEVKNAIKEAANIETKLKKASAAQKNLIQHLVKASAGGAYQVDSSKWIDDVLSATQGINEKDVNALKDMDWTPGKVSAAQLKKNVNEAIQRHRTKEKQEGQKGEKIPETKGDTKKKIQEIINSGNKSQKEVFNLIRDELGIQGNAEFVKEVLKLTKDLNASEVETLKKVVRKEKPKDLKSILNSLRIAREAVKKGKVRDLADEIASKIKSGKWDAYYKIIRPQEAMFIGSASWKKGQTKRNKTMVGKAKNGLRLAAYVDVKVILNHKRRLKVEFIETPVIYTENGNIYKHTIQKGAIFVFKVR